MIDITSEINFQTARSGGKGGQNVNKVETMVEGRWHIETSTLVSEEQKHIIFSKLSSRITKDGFLLVKSQEERSQLANKEIVLKKMNQMVSLALVKKKARIASKPSKAAKEKRLEGKRLQSMRKQNRSKPFLD